MSTIQDSASRAHLETERRLLAASIEGASEVTLFHLHTQHKSNKCIKMCW